MIQVSRSQLRRVVVAVDPATTANEESDETGIIVTARGPHQPETCKFDTRCPGHGYVLADYTCRLSPSGWARQVIRAFDEWEADRVVAEVNNGGDMVGETIHAQRIGIPYEAVRATRGKFTRAEPVAALYEQGRYHHLGSFPELEDQMTTWTNEDPGHSPDRMDALVWGATSLKLIGGQGLAFLVAWEDEAAAAHEAANALRTGEDSPPPKPPTPPPLNFEEYSAVKYQVLCPSSINKKHRWFGDPPQCVQCGTVSPLVVAS